jgi:hypothetical protein
MENIELLIKIANASPALARRADIEGLKAFERGLLSCKALKRRRKILFETIG